MGTGLSVELGHDSLHETNLTELQQALQHVRLQDRETSNLDLSNRFLGLSGSRVAAEALARAKHLLKLNLSYNQLGGPLKKKTHGRPRTAESPAEEIGMLYIAEAMARNTVLLSLNLAGNNLDLNGTHAAAQMLRKNKTLEELVLYNNSINDDCVPDLCDALANNTTLLRLNLDYNDITDRGAEMLFAVLSTNQTLGYLSLKFNEGVSADWGKRIDDILAGNREAQKREQAAREERIRQQRLKEEEEERRQAVRDAAVQAERERVNAEYHEMEERRRKEEEEEQKRRAEEEERRTAKRAARETKAAIQAEHTDNLINLAYAWRETLQGGERRGREWRSGFESYKDVTCGRDTFSPPPPLNRQKLYACWCEPTDQTVAYQGQLHYHCIHEPQAADQYRDGGGRKYHGCGGTAHPCRSAPVTYQADRNGGSLFSTY